MEPGSNTPCGGIKQIWNAVTKANSEGLTPDDILPKLPLEDYEYLARQYEGKSEELKNQHERIVTGFWRQLQGKEFAAEILMNAYMESSLDTVIEKYKSLISEKDKYYFDENMVNSFARGLLNEGAAGKAVELLKIHAVAFPESAQVHSFLGDALLADGKREEAIKAYTKALSLNPSSKAMKEKLEKAKSSKK
jgi:predicted negative regulator of RcsB-dependent stress response